MNGQYERFEQESLIGGKYRWHFRAQNGNVLFGSTEGYHNASERDLCMISSMDTNRLTPVIDIPVTNKLGSVAANALFNRGDYGLLGLKLPIK